MKAEANNLGQGPTAQAEEMPVLAGQIFWLREVLGLPPAAREYFAKTLRSLADLIESGNGSVPAGQKVGNRENESPCLECRDRNQCEKPCDKLAKHLPGVTGGRGCKENTTGLHVETLKDYEQTRRLEIFQQYQDCKDIFTGKQWEVIWLYYGKGLTQDQIAETTGKKRSAISGLLSRAKQTKKKHDEQMREKVLALRRREV